MVLFVKDEKKVLLLRMKLMMTVILEIGRNLCMTLLFSHNLFLNPQFCQWNWRQIFCGCADNDVFKIMDVFGYSDISEEVEE